MIIVKSLNIIVAQFTDLQDLARNFKPAWGKLRDYTYIDTEKDKHISWVEVSYEMRKNEHKQIH